MTCLNLRMVDRLSRSQLGGRVCFPEPFSWASASQRLHGAGRPRHASPRHGIYLARLGNSNGSGYRINFSKGKFL